MDNINNSDIYKISSFVNDIQSKYIDANNDTLHMGIFGYLNEMFSTEIQNSIISMSEYANEAFPIRSKFEKSILTYAMMYNIKNINANPSIMNVLIGFDKNVLDKNLNSENKFILDKSIPIVIGEYEFHLDYNIQIEKIKLLNSSIGEYIYTARYLMDNKNPCSDITNPYLQAPIEMINYEDDTKVTFISINCFIRQVSTSVINTKILTNNIFDNKTIDFEFDEQMVCFEVVINKPDGVKLRLKPIFEGVSIETGENYCYYSYLNSRTIRIKFDRDCYEPSLNDTIDIELQVTNGEKGNIEYNKNIVVPLKSDKYNYNSSSYMVVQPTSNAVYGTNRKSTDQLKNIIPKEILARGTIINNKDIENYFNNLEGGRIEFYKKIDNQIQRLYYAYLIVKDMNNNVIPTNTLDLLIDEDVFNNPSNDRLCIEPGVVSEYSNDKCVINSLVSITTGAALEKEKSNFIYTSPFTLVIDKSPLRISYFMTNVDNEVKLEYSYINNTARYQFVCNSLRCKKNYLINNNRSHYNLSCSITQNSLKNIELVEEQNGLINHNSSKIRIMLVVEAHNGKKYYTEGVLTDISVLNPFMYNVNFNLHCSETINESNTVTIYDMKRVIKDDGVSILKVEDIEVDESAKMYIYTFIDSDIEGETCINPKELYDVIYEYDDATIKTKDDLYNKDRDQTCKRKTIKDGFILTNIYNTYNNLFLFYNFSDSIRSTVEIKSINDRIRYLIKSVPLVRYSYINDPENIDRYNFLFSHIQNRKFYMDIALKELEESFDFDLKFFNTYGPSKLFRVGRKDMLLNKVNLSLKFNVKLFAGVDNSIINLLKDDIKNYIENINESVDDIHMSNLTQTILNKYGDSVKYIEFIDINDLGVYIQYLQKIDMQNVSDVPEFLNINLLDNVEPDIEITLV